MVLEVFEYCAMVRYKYLGTMVAWCEYHAKGIGARRWSPCGAA